MFFAIFVSGNSGLMISVIIELITPISHIRSKWQPIFHYWVSVITYPSCPKIIMFQFQYSVKVVSADSPVLQCQGICCHYSDLSFILIWWLWFLGSYASVAVCTFADCTLNRLWFSRLSLKWVSLVLEIYYRKSGMISVFDIRCNWNVFSFHKQEILCPGLIPLCIID